jgi:hypothetical protein
VITKALGRYLEQTKKLVRLSFVNLKRHIGPIGGSHGLINNYDFSLKSDNKSTAKVSRRNKKIG